MGASSGRGRRWTTPGRPRLAQRKTLRLLPFYRLSSLPAPHPHTMPPSPRGYVSRPPPYRISTVAPTSRELVRRNQLIHIASTSPLDSVGPPSNLLLPNSIPGPPPPLPPVLPPQRSISPPISRIKDETDIKITFRSQLVWDRGGGRAEQNMRSSISVVVPRSSVASHDKLRALMRNQVGSDEEVAFAVTTPDGSSIRAYVPEEWRSAVERQLELVVHLKVVGTESLHYAKGEDWHMCKWGITQNGGGD